MNNITPFLFEEDGLVRVISKDGEPWFIAADVCKIIGLTNPSVAVQALDADERAKLNLGRQGDATIISESGLYTLILRSRRATTPGTLPHRFRRWVTHDVLPTIRKTGGYKATVIPPNDPPDEVRDMALNLRTVTETRQSWGVKSAQQMWLRLGLPTVPAMFEPQSQPTLFEYADDRGAM